MELSELRIGDLLLVKGTGLISEAIECVEHSCYSHIAGYVGHRQLIEAEGFRRTGYAPISKYTGHADVYRCDDLTRDQRWGILKLATWSIGGRYDYRLLAAEFIRYWLGVLIPYRAPPNARICSTLWVGLFRDVGIDLCPGIKYPTPADVSQSKLLRKIGSI